VITVSAKELHIHTADVLQAVEKGEEIVVTFRGTPHSKILPIKTRSLKKTRLAAIGMWEDRDELVNPTAFVNRLREPRTF